MGSKEIIFALLLTKSEGSHGHSSRITKRRSQVRSRIAIGYNQQVPEDQIPMYQANYQTKSQESRTALSVSNQLSVAIPGISRSIKKDRGCLSKTFLSGQLLSGERTRPTSSQNNFQHHKFMTLPLFLSH
jgi:hypothetical protein